LKDGAIMVETDGSVINEAVTESGQQKWFAFNAVAGSTYSIDVDLVTLPDSMLEIIARDQTTVLAENDDDARCAALAAQHKA
jgi:hypothetical protein